MRLYIVDAFADTAFAGNPAGVVLLDEPADPAWMQSVAAELKHAETAFVEVGGAGAKSLRWFTPTVEVDLCGHATLATGHVLGGSQVFTTRSGELRTRAEDGWVRMDFPADPPHAAADEVAPALPGVTVREVLRGKWDILVRAADAAEVRGLSPDLDGLAGLDARCVVVTAPGDKPGIDFVSRVFGPAVGVPEDPVTGSAHCTLSPYWSAELGRDELVGEQASPRGGIVRVALHGERVVLAGQAVTTVRGELLV
ncbi:PhzF family phenazine biosynthesis protein [Amycolatopsis acidiphila]|uniref:PhzF family phenazine biosynthesis protein n=1 Tax=Amycolatopsis acidiphila TaxID=715473 RepID=A0A558AJP5_9PSEU|nr:PhzF family phenazine biosynthesis protein [Amycolatopsis acidiphila]TVT24482.1 PhzF family phenazine biosynthesis protein [Amycolatopsis acidiphila]UIJ59307.1 PhzF family phenazine biosynthesis protein [Amycolatopsis acidiphila]GHG79622.1 isomerase [Amycolatopsis acidiphila]